MLSMIQGSAHRGWAADFHVQFGMHCLTSPQSQLHWCGSVSWIKLQTWGSWVAFCPLAVYGLGRVVGAKINRVRSKMRSVTGFGLNCWHRSEVVSSEAGWCLVAKWMNRPVGELYELHLSLGVLAARLHRASCGYGNTHHERPQHQYFSQLLSVFRQAAGRWWNAGEKPPFWWEMRGKQCHQHAWAPSSRRSWVSAQASKLGSDRNVSLSSQGVLVWFYFFCLPRSLVGRGGLHLSRGWIAVSAERHPELQKPCLQMPLRSVCFI